jgi:hypothetical protein
VACVVRAERGRMDMEVSTMVAADRPDALDEINAFRAGYRHGANVGRVSPREAESEMRRFGMPINSSAVECFCNGAEDGARGDTFRYVLSFAVSP